MKCLFQSKDNFDGRVTEIYLISVIFRSERYVEKTYWNSFVDTHHRVDIGDTRAVSGYTD